MNKILSMFGFDNVPTRDERMRSLLKDIHTLKKFLPRCAIVDYGNYLTIRFPHSKIGLFVEYPLPIGGAFLPDVETITFNLDTKQFVYIREYGYDDFKRFPDVIHLIEEFKRFRKLIKDERDNLTNVL
jgi:hypothetical protein